MAETVGWLADKLSILPARARVVGVTAGASTPNNKVGEVIERIFATRGIEVAVSMSG